MPASSEVPQAYSEKGVTLYGDLAKRIVVLGIQEALKTHGTQAILAAMWRHTGALLGPNANTEQASSFLFDGEGREMHILAYGRIRYVSGSDWLTGHPVSLTLEDDPETGMTACINITNTARQSVIEGLIAEESAVPTELDIEVYSPAEDNGVKVDWPSSAELGLNLISSAVRMLHSMPPQMPQPAPSIRPTLPLQTNYVY